MKKSTLKFIAIAMFFLMGTAVMAQTQFPVTFSVDMTDADPFDPATDELYMSGTFAGWTTPGDSAAFKMEPLDVGSMIYTLTYTIDSGEVQYKYFRVIDGVPSWTEGDEWEGDPNRKVYLTDTTTYENVWANKPHDITFNVDMTGVDPFDPATDAVYITGTLANGWSKPGTLSPYMMTTDDEVIYSITLLLYPGDYAYKYFRVINGEASWDNGEPVANDRGVLVDTIAATIDNVWGDITGIFNEPNVFTYSMYPNPVVTVLNIGNTTDVTSVDVFDVTGKLVRTTQVVFSQSVTIDVADLNAGIYIVNVTNNKGTQSSKFIKN